MHYGDRRRRGYCTGTSAHHTEMLMGNPIMQRETLLAPLYAIIYRFSKLLISIIFVLLETGKMLCKGDRKYVTSSD